MKIFTENARSSVSKKLIFVLIGLGISSTAMASEVTIPNTFSNGDPADAEDVNSNFSAVESAVNDNHSRLSIAESAVADHETRISDLEGVGTVSVAAHAFETENATLTQAQNCFVRKRYSRAYAHFIEHENAPSSISGGCDAVAGIQLPHGATLKGLHCTVWDQSGSEPNSGGVNDDIEARLVQSSMISGDNTTVFLTPSSENSQSLQTLTDTTPEPGTETVDNTVFTYFLVFNYDADFTEVGEDLRFYGCRVEYD